MVNATDPAYLARLVNALPAAAFVLDGIGTIRFATAAAAEMIGRQTDDMVGHSVLEFVSEDAAWAYASAVAMADDYPDVVMGPLRIEFIHADGKERCADLWAVNHLDDPVIGGVVCLLAPEMAATRLAEAVGALAAGAEFEIVAHLVSLAMHGAPVDADAAIVQADGDTLRVVANNGVPEDLIGTDRATSPWLATVETGARIVHADLAGLDPSWQARAAASGHHAVWVEPVGGPDEVGERAFIVLWCRRTGSPSPNQLSSIYEAAGILALALRLRQPTG